MPPLHPKARDGEGFEVREAAVVVDEFNQEKEW
jgi:hypothetical protein